MKSKNLLLLLVLASLWGPSFLFIKLAVAEIPPISLAALRIGIAAVVLFLLIFVRGGIFSRDLRFWKHVTIAGFFAHGLPFVLISWGEIYIDSALASILNGLTPLFTLILAHFTIADDRLNVSKTIGAVVGFFGLAVLLSPHMLIGFEATTIGVIAIIIGALSYGVAMVYSRIYLKGTKPLQAPASQLLVTAVYLIPISLWLEGPYLFADYSIEALASLLVLAVFGTAVAFIMYYRILESASASYLSLVTYIMPVYGIILGMIFLGENISIYSILGGVLIIGGIMVANKTISINLSINRLKRILAISKFK